MFLSELWVLNGKMQNSRCILNCFKKGCMLVREPIILRDQIEQSRQELRRLVERHGMHDDKVLKQSMVLDELINKYTRLIEKY
ncbi:aspartyl-phosphate phosphatase Spo0E family protein [Paenibacillus taichungensis]|uniref:aspartyl-phosphate phosphatase Spo0E family protein n=1 Tax=Paenibacillus taichungensis TaxID=484184 RepID=UPI002DB67E0A|nr:aspartyl-phosphate phosphatase Spo0E family protein [Paenibacillus taichungensis]